MKKLFNYTSDISVSYYLLSLRVNKNHRLVNIELAKQKYKEEIYILNSLHEQNEIDFTKISHEAINNVLVCISFFDTNQSLSWDDMKSKEFITILLLSLNIFNINLLNFYSCQIHYLHYFKRMHCLGFDITGFSAAYLEQVNIYELEHERSFIELGNEVIEEMGLESTPVDNEDMDDLHMYSEIFDVPMKRIKEIVEETYESIGEIIDGIPRAKFEIVSEMIKHYPVKHKYKSKEGRLYLYYGDEPLYAPFRFEMLLDLLETLYNQGATIDENNSNI